jgi:CRP-like cAMP-binding protein
VLKVSKIRTLRKLFLYREAFKSGDKPLSTEKKFKKGEVIVKEGDTPKTFYIIQSGKVSVFLERGGQKIEIDLAGPGQIIGEQGIFGFPKQTYTYEATSEVKVTELPIDPLKTVYEKSPAPIKLFLKALGEDIRRARNNLRSLKQEQDNSPCPPRFIPRLCAILALVAKNSGVKPKVDPTTPVHKLEEERAKNPNFKDTDTILSFSTLKIYTSRMFFESHQRMQSFCELLGKLGYLTPLYEKNPDTEQLELTNVRVHDIQTIELFGDFYQHNFFKAGKSEQIHLEPLAYVLARAFSELSANAEADRNQVVKLDYKQFVLDLKEKFHIDMKETHINLLEKKGLFVKRQSVNEVVYLSFDRKEFTTMYKFWQIINEIDHWNQKGIVDVNANYNEIKAHAGPSKCPSCKVELKLEAKFCPECGHKLAQPEAA